MWRTEKEIKTGASSMNTSKSPLKKTLWASLIIEISLSLTITFGGAGFGFGENFPGASKWPFAVCVVYFSGVPHLTFSAISLPFFTSPLLPLTAFSLGSCLRACTLHLGVWIVRIDYIHTPFRPFPPRNCPLSGIPTPPSQFVVSRRALATGKPIYLPYCV